MRGCHRLVRPTFTESRAGLKNRECMHRPSVHRAVTSDSLEGPSKWPSHGDTQDAQHLEIRLFWTARTPKLIKERVVGFHRSLTLFPGRARTAAGGALLRHLWHGDCNVVASLELGLRTFDGAVAGLGGCPYAPGTSRNVVIEELVYLLHRIGYETGIDLPRLATAGAFISTILERPPASRMSMALAKCAT